MRVKKLLSLLSAAAMAVTSLTGALTITASAATDNKYFNFQWNTMNGGCYTASLNPNENYEGITEIEFPATYNDGSHGDAVVVPNPPASGFSNDTIKTVSTASNWSCVYSGVFKGLNALETIKYTCEGTFTVNASAFSECSNTLKDVYIMASEVKPKAAGAKRSGFNGFPANAILHVSSDEVRNSIIDTFTTGITADKIVVEGGSSLPTPEVEVICEDITYGTEGGFKPSATVKVDGQPVEDANITYKMYTDEGCANEGPKYSGDTIPAGTYYIKAFVARTESYNDAASAPKEVHVNRVANITKLQEAIEKANGYITQTDVYSTGSLNILTQAVNAGKALTANTPDAYTATQETVDAATEAIENAIKGLVKKADEATVEEWANFLNANNDFPKENNNTYTDDSWANYMEAYQVYLDARAKNQGSFTSKQLTEILDAVNKAKSELKALPPKTEAFEAAKKKYEDIINAKDSPYTKDSLKDLKEVCDIQINGILDENGDLKEGVNQADVDNATRAIGDYINRLLVEKGDVTELKKLAEEYKPLIESDYTVDTWTTFSEKLATAQALVDDPDNAGKEAVATATEELKAAREQLVIDYSEGEKNPGIAVVKPGGRSVVIEKGTADESMAGATKVRVTFDCAADTTFSSYASIEVTALVGADNNFKKFTGNNNTTGAKGCSVTLDFANAIKTGDSYTISADTYAWNEAADYVYAIMKLEYLDANGNVLKTFSGGTDTPKLDNYKKAIEDAKALVESGEYTEESVAALQTAIDNAQALLDETEGKPLPSQMEAPKAALDDAVKALVALPKGDISGTIKTPGADAEVTVTVATADGETVAEATAANGEYSISDLEDGEYIVTFAADGYAARSYTAAVAGGSVTLEAEIHLYGDVNGDGEITTADVGMANSHAREVSALEGYDFDVAEVTGDGEVTTADVGVINATAQKI